MEVLEAPRYNPATAARLVQLNRQRVSRWLKGYEFTYSTKKGKQKSKKPPVIRRNPTDWKHYASFLDLIDLLFVKQFLEAGIPLQKLRKALVEAANIIGGRHFAQRYFFTDGRSIYLDLKDQKEEARELLELLSGGQWVIAPVITQVSRQIRFDENTGYAERWYPLGHDRRVIIDPNISFGRPTLEYRGVATSAIYDLYIAEGEDYSTVSDLMGLEHAEVEEAVFFEDRLRGNEVLHR